MHLQHRERLLHAHVAHDHRHALVGFRSYVAGLKFDAPGPSKIGTLDEPTVEPGLTPEYEFQEQTEADQAADNDAEGAGMCPADGRTLAQQHDQPDDRGDADEGGDVEPFKLHNGFTPT